jgi:Lipoate synthase
LETKLIEHKKSKSNNWVKLDIRNRNSESKISTKNNFGFKKKPEWIRVKLPTGKKYSNLRGLVDKYKLNTICSSGSCPNMGECWGEGTATFMILGNICTRSCGFCGVKLADHFQWIGKNQKRLLNPFL